MDSIRLLPFFVNKKRGGKMPRSQLIFRFFRENPLSVGQILQLGDVGIGTDGHQHIPAF